MSSASGRSDLRPTNLAAAPHIHFEFVLGSKIGDLVASSTSCSMRAFDWLYEPVGQRSADPKAVPKPADAATRGGLS